MIKWDNKIKIINVKSVNIHLEDTKTDKFIYLSIIKIVVQ